MTMIAVGVDIGGTCTRVAAVDRNGRILVGCRIPTPDDGNAEEFVLAVFRAIGDVLRESNVSLAEIRGIGLALPGILDRQLGTLVRSVNLSGLEGYPIRDELARRIQWPLILMTDAEAATWGEYATLEEPPRRFVHLRLGTGIACGVVVDGELQSLDEGRTTHLPALVVESGPNAKPCPCGLTGCLETVASGSALLSEAGRAGYADGLARLRHASETGDMPACQILDRATQALGVALDNLVEDFQAEVISLGGGVIDQLPILIDAATASRTESGEVPPTKGSPPVSIERSQRGDDAGVIGAALLAIERQ